MKAIGTKNRIKIFAVSLLLSLALVLSTVFTFGYGGTVGASAADEESDKEYGIRFVQVAAGKDFAIGLTFDGKLYGWSLDAENTNTALNPDTTGDLGDYYTKTPTEIPVVFRIGPGTTTNNYAFASENYNTPTTDKIVAIAATSTTAAFITQKGAIYTWGKDGKDIDGGYGSMPRTPNYLLLRASDQTMNYGHGSVHWYEPYIVDYNYYGTDTDVALYSARLRPNKERFSSMSLAGGENNYIFVFKQNDKFYNFVWGSVLYVNVHALGNGYKNAYNFKEAEGLVNISDSISYRATYETQYVAKASDTSGFINLGTTGKLTAVAGGYNVGMNASAVTGTNTTTLSVRGKNFISSGNFAYDDSSKTLTPEYIYNPNEQSFAKADIAGADGDITSKGLSEITYTQNSIEYTVKGGLAGNYFSYGRDAAGAESFPYEINWSGDAVGTPSGRRKSDLYYARQSVSSESGATATLTYSVAALGENESGICDAAGDNIVSPTKGEYATIIRNAVSLGNDIGYGIADSGKLHAWGDSANYQNGLNTKVSSAYPVWTLQDKTFVSVAAGKQMSPASNVKPFNADNSINIATDSSSGTTTYSLAHKNESAYITGAITSDGKLYAWSDIIHEPKEIVYGNAAGKVSEYNKFVAVYSGYEHNLFAITKLGKLVRITCKEGDTEFTQEIYDTFKQVDASTPVQKSAEDTYIAYRWADVTNWSITASEKANVKFTIDVHPTVAASDPAIGTMTLFVNAAKADKTSIFLNDVQAKVTSDTDSTILPQDYSGRSRSSLVSSNAIGDTYRILGYTNDDKIKYIAASSTGDGVTAPSAASLEDVEPKFAFKAKGSSTYTDMNEDQWKHMFSYEVVYDAVYGVGIKIKPKQSTKNGTVRVKFHVARYDCVKNFNSTASTALYYDHLECSAEFTIDNSKSYMTKSDTFAADKDGKAGMGNSYIPMLDPNNVSNRYYSIALQDVSTGVLELVKHVNGGTENAQLLKLITDEMSRVDTGYPASSKIADGNLAYYLGADAAAGYYNDKYQFLFADRDADILGIDRADMSVIGGAANGSIALDNRDNYAVTIRLSGLTSSDNGLTTKVTMAKADSVVKTFNNVYGIFNIQFTAGTGENEAYVDGMVFSYYVLRYRADKTTGKISYRDGGDITSYNTVSDTNLSSYMNCSLTASEYTRYTDEFLIDFDVTDIYFDKIQAVSDETVASVFAQASVRFNDRHLVNGKYVYGDADGGNNHLDVSFDGEYKVGDPDLTLNLSDYITNLDENFVSFSYENEASKLTEFEAEFPDPIVGGNYITAEKGKITIRLTSAHPIYFTVTVQRFYGSEITSGKLNSTKYFTNGDEKVTISVSVPKVSSIAFSEPASSTQAARTFPISREMKVYVFGKVTAPEAVKNDVVNSNSLVALDDKYRSLMKMSGLDVSDTNVLRVSKDSNSVLTVTPEKSGKAIVKFVLTVYDKSIPITLSFNVSGETPMQVENDKGEKSNLTVNLSDTQYVYMSTLLTGLQNVVGQNVTVGGSVTVRTDNFAPIYDDKTDVKEVDKNGKPTSKVRYTKFGAVYFERVDENGNPIVARAGEAADGEADEDKEPGLPDYLPPFVKSIKFMDTTTKGKEYLRFEIDPEASQEKLEGTYKVYVKFVDSNKKYKNYEEAEKAGDAILTTTFLLTSTKKVASENGKMIEIHVNCDKPKKQGDSMYTDWYTNNKKDLDTIVYVPLQYLCERAGIEYDNYQIFLVTAAEGAGKYINPVGGTEDTRNYLRITPILNTPKDEPITLNVSIRKNDNGIVDSKIISFGITVRGISTTLPASQYTTIWLVAFFSSLGFLMIIFLIRMIIYWRKRGKQRALIKRNQELIKMRDRIHNRTASATREQVVRTKLKMQDPKYAKMFNEMKKDKGGDFGVSVSSDDFGATSTPKKSKKKKSGKKSMAELKAELAAKKAAFAQAQNGNNGAFATPTFNPFGDAPDAGAAYGAPPPDFGTAAPDFGSPADAFVPSDLESDAIIFDAPDIDNGSQG